jgi:hypothetical protein
LDDGLELIDILFLQIALAELAFIRLDSLKTSRYFLDEMTGKALALLFFGFLRGILFRHCGHSSFAFVPKLYIEQSLPALTVW